MRIKSLVWFATLAGAAACGALCARRLMKKKERKLMYDYSHRSGFPKLRKQSKGLAQDFKIPEDMRIPELLRPWPAPPHSDPRRLN